MNVCKAWEKFISSGRIDHYIEYTSLKRNLEKSNADNNQSACNKSDGYKG